MSRIQERFASLTAQGRKGLIPYVTAGDPSAEHTVPLMHALAKAGADVIELGIPFSDPMADGPIIQKAAERAIARGVGISQVIAMAQEFRKTDTTTPIVLMGYANPIEAMGVEPFANAAQAAGVDGVLVVDYPPEECMEFAKSIKSRGMSPIFLIAPTTTETRIAQIAHHACAYLYYVSLKGITGASTLEMASVAEKIPLIKAHTQVPIAVGFGVRDAATACAIANIADAVVIGSRIIQLMEQAGPDRAIAAAAEFLNTIRVALDQ